MIKKVGVVGAGMMGAEIALCFAREGFEVKLNDISLEIAEKGKQNLVKTLDRAIKKGKMTEEGKAAALDAITPTGELLDLADTDLVIEAVLENVDIKNNVFKTLDEACGPDTILASNTSSISITKLAAAVSDERKAKFIGTHFNSPASVMELVEVIPALLTAPETTAEILDLLKGIGKAPVKVKDVVGFGLNRIFHAMYLEALRLLEEGVVDSPEDIDTIVTKGLGHPVGTCKLLDMTSHPLNQAVDEILFAEYGDRFRPSPVLRRLNDSGRYGRKVGKGFYDYDK